VEATNKPKDTKNKEVAEKEKSVETQKIDVAANLPATKTTTVVDETKPKKSDVAVSAQNIPESTSVDYSRANNDPRINAKTAGIVAVETQTLGSFKGSPLDTKKMAAIDHTPKALSRPNNDPRNKPIATNSQESTS
jgi:ribonuclease E